MFSDERVTETTRIISEDEVPPEILAEIRRKEESHTDVKAKKIGASFGAGLAAALVKASQKNDAPAVEKSNPQRYEQVTASKQIISDEKFSPEISGEENPANVEPKKIGTHNGVNVGALMSAGARLKADKPSDETFRERSTKLVEKFVNAAKAGEEQHAERIRSKTKNFLDAFRRGQQSDK